MTQPKRFHLHALTLAITAASGFANPAAAAEETRNATLLLEEVVVTATARPVSKLESSVSVSSVGTEQIGNFAPRTTAEIFRNIPGIRSESSGGEGNANISVRGLPQPDGGGRYVQLQEDGLPVVHFGDMNFATADVFLRADATLQKVEAIRGGSASTFVSNAPGAVINFISKTGEEEAGSIAVTTGLDYDSLRTDFEYGGPIADGWRFHVGGFVREGEGAREAGYTAESGGQLKANLTKELDNGYVRVYVKHLEDSGIGYFPQPMKASEDDVPGLDANSEVSNSPYLLTNLTLDREGNLRRGDISKGMNPQVFAYGAEFSFDLENGWTLQNRFRKAEMDGQFLGLFSADVGTREEMLAAFGAAGGSFSYANGPGAGSAFPANANGNGLVQRIHLFDTELRDFGNFANELKLSRTFDNFTVTLGYYLGTQSIDADWHWNTYAMEVAGNDAALLNITDAGGNTITDNGLVAYGVPFWGNCCTLGYDVETKVRAPFAAVEMAFGDLTVDASVRRDIGEATGAVYKAGAMQSRDINGDGIISVPESSVPVVDIANPDRHVNYDWGYTSFSAGANYLLTDELAVFARYSDGARAQVDRTFIFGGDINPDSGDIPNDAVTDDVEQLELGVKWRSDFLTLFATAFFADVELTSADFTQPGILIDNTYESRGLELEYDLYILSNFSVNGSITWTDAEITNGANEGNTPQRQADLVYTLTPSYGNERFSTGLNIVGTTDSYVSDGNTDEMDGFVQVNAFFNYNLSDALSASLNVNNVFDEIGITEVNGINSDGRLMRARSINGRTSSLSLRYIF